MRAAAGGATFFRITRRPRLAATIPRTGPHGASAVVEFLNLVLILIAALLVLRKPEMERVAFRMLVVSTLLMVFLFTLATRSGLLPGLNY